MDATLAFSLGVLVGICEMPANFIALATMTVLMFKAKSAALALSVAIPLFAALLRPFCSQPITTATIGSSIAFSLIATGALFINTLSQLGKVSDWNVTQPFYSNTLSPLWGIALLMLAMELVRFDRTARWLEMPKGLRCFLFVLPLTITLILTQGFL